MEKKILLAIIDGKDAGTFTVFSQDQVILGRAKSDVSFRVSEQFVSRKHCTIARKADGYALTDLGSTHGTLVNGKPAKEIMLEDGDLIEIRPKDVHEFVRLAIRCFIGSEEDLLRKALELEEINRNTEPVTKSVRWDIFPEVLVSLLRNNLYQFGIIGIEINNFKEFEKNNGHYLARFSLKKVRSLLDISFPHSATIIARKEDSFFVFTYDREVPLDIISVIGTSKRATRYEERLSSLLESMSKELSGMHSFDIAGKTYEIDLRTSSFDLSREGLFFRDRKNSIFSLEDIYRFALTEAEKRLFRLDPVSKTLNPHYFIEGLKQLNSFDFSLFMVEFDDLRNINAMNTLQGDQALRTLAEDIYRHFDSRGVRLLLTRDGNRFYGIPSGDDPVATAAVMNDFQANFAVEGKKPKTTTALLKRADILDEPNPFRAILEYFSFCEPTHIFFKG